MSDALTGDEEPDPMLGKVFDERYRIEKQLGQGGIGRVYIARHLTLGRMVAIKVLLTEYEEIGVLKKRFEREAEALAALSHPNIVTVTDFGVVDHNPYIVMELLEGADLSQLIAREPLDPKRVFEIMRQSLRALHYAHEQGLVHRDLKPHNIFVRDLGDTDHAHVLDFGLARFVGDASKSSSKLTRQGALLGTPAYMAPEQASGEDVDKRADIYAMGCVIFEALTGRRPFQSSDPGKVIRAHLLSQPPTLAEADPGLKCSPELEALVACCLEKSPAGRYPTAKDMLAALDALPADAAVRIGPRKDVHLPIDGLAPTQTGHRSAPTRPGGSGGGGGGQGTETRPSRPSKVQAARRESMDEVVLPTRKPPIVLGLVLGGFGVLALLSAVAWFVFGGEEEPAVVDPPPVVEPTPVVAPTPQPAPVVLERPPARDPFAADGELAPPRRLRNIRTNQLRGRYPRADSETLAESFNGTPAEVALAHLLTAHAYIADSNDADRFQRALDHYSEALRIDPGVRGDELLRQDLMALICSIPYRVVAGGLYTHHLGTEFLDELVAAGASPSARDFRCDRPSHLSELADSLRE